MAVAPDHFYGRQLASLRKLPVAIESEGSRIGMQLRTVSFHIRGVLELQRPVNQVHIMATHIAKSAVTKVPPIMPVVGMIAGVKRLHRCGAYPQIPVQRFWYRLRNFGAIDNAFVTPPTTDAAKPDMDLCGIPNRSGLNQFDGASIIFTRMILRSHLRDHFLFAG